jgi:hypothetical protein
MNLKSCSFQNKLHGLISSQSVGILKIKTLSESYLKGLYGKDRIQ